MLVNGENQIGERAQRLSLARPKSSTRPIEVSKVGTAVEVEVVFYVVYPL